MVRDQVNVEDAQLVESAVAGDRDAFAAIYDRYADPIHDFCTSVLRDPHEAADATQDTFLLAAERLGQLRDATKLKSWLFAIARHRALRIAKGRSRTVLTGEDAEVAAVEPVVDDPAYRLRLQKLVRDAADGLSERDRAVLDLSLRQGLEGQELADALGVDLGHSYVMVSRLKDQVERSLGALLVARDTRSDCEELETVLRGWDGQLSPLLRKRVARHIDSCEACSDQRRRLANPLVLLSESPAFACPADVREHVLTNLRLASSRRLPRAWGDDGFPPGIDGARRRLRRPLTAALAMIAVIIAVLVISASALRESPMLVDAGTSTPLPTSTSVVAAAPPSAGVSGRDRGTPAVGAVPAAAKPDATTAGGPGAAGDPSAVADPFSTGTPSTPDPSTPGSTDTGTTAADPSPTGSTPAKPTCGAVASSTCLPGPTPPGPGSPR